MIMTFGKVYRYKGVTFEWHDYLGPIIINRHTEKERNYRNISLRIIGIITQFSKLNKVEREQHRIN